MKGVMAVLVGLVLFVGLIVGFTEFGYRLDKHYQPLQEQVRHDTFENSATKVDGDARDMSNMRIQYNSPDLSQAQKDAIRDVFQQRYCSLDPSKIPGTLLTFWHQMGCN